MSKGGMSKNRSSRREGTGAFVRGNISIAIFSGRTGTFAELFHDFSLTGLTGQQSAFAMVGLVPPEALNCRTFVAMSYLVSQIIPLYSFSESIITVAFGPAPASDSIFSWGEYDVDEATRSCFRAPDGG